MKSKEYFHKLEKSSKKEGVKEYFFYLIKTINDLLKNQEINVIVDMGCGLGYNSSLLTQYFCDSKVFSVDYAQHNLDYGIACGFIKNPILSNVYNVNKVFTSINIKADLVFLGDVIEHLDNAPLALENIYNILKPQGFFVIHTPNRYYSKFFKLPKDPTHFHEFSPFELVKLVKNAKFYVNHLYPSGFPLINKVNPSLSQKLAYTQLASAIFTLIPFLGPSMLLITQRK